MAIGTPTYLGGASDATNTVTTLVITTGATASAGNAILVAIIGGSAVITSLVVTDSAGNTYALTVSNSWGGGNRELMAYCANPALLSSGGTITLTWTGAARVGAAAVSVSGLGLTTPLDITGAGTTGTGTSDSIATGTLTQANEIIIAVTALSNTSAGYAPGGSFTTLTAPTQGVNCTLLWSYQIVAVATTVTYAPSWTTSRTFGSNVFTFKQAGGAVASVGGTLSMMGV